MLLLPRILVHFEFSFVSFQNFSPSVRPNTNLIMHIFFGACGNPLMLLSTSFSESDVFCFFRCLFCLSLAAVLRGLSEPVK